MHGGVPFCFFMTAFYFCVTMKKRNFIRSKMKHIKSTALILAAGSMWGVIGLFSIPLNEAGILFLFIICFRAVLTTLLLAGVIAIRDKKLFRVAFKDLWMFFGMGVLSFVLFNLCYFISMQANGSLAVAAVLLYTAPVFIMILSLMLFREKLTLYKGLALLLSVAGCVLVSAPDGAPFSTKGIFFGVLSGLGYALYSIFGRYALQKYASLTCSFYAFLMAAIVTLPAFFFQLPGEALLLPALPYLLGIAVVSTFLPYICYTAGLMLTTPARASIIACIEPAVAALAGFFIYGQRLSWAAAAGILLVLFSVCLLQIKKEP